MVAFVEFELGQTKYGTIKFEVVLLICIYESLMIEIKYF